MADQKQVKKEPHRVSYKDMNEEMHDVAVSIATKSLKAFENGKQLPKLLQFLVTPSQHDTNESQTTQGRRNITLRWQLKLRTN